MKKIFSTSIITLFIIVFAYFLIASGEGENASTEFSTYTVKRRSINQSIIATGIIKPKVGAEVKVGAQVSGVVKNLFVRTGSRVKKNDLLAVIDPRPYQSQRDKMLALKKVAAIDAKYAELDFKRNKSLFDQGVLSLKEYESSEQLYELALANLTKTESDFEYAELQLSYTEILSPINGVIASISTQEGETVAAGFISPTFVTIIDLNQLELWSYVDETDIGRVKKSQKVTFTVDTYPGEEFEGVVETIYPKAEIQNNVVNYITVVKVIPGKDKILRPEMTATVQTYIQQRENILVVPKNAIHSENKKMFVKVLTNGETEKKFITTGISDRKYYEVLSGISENEKIILN